MKTAIRITCEETKLERPDRRLFCLLLWDRRLKHCRLLKSGSRRAVAAYKGALWDPVAKSSPAHKWLGTRISN